MLYIYAWCVCGCRVIIITIIITISSKTMELARLSLASYNFFRMSGRPRSTSGTFVCTPGQPDRAKEARFPLKLTQREETRGGEK